MARRHAGDTWWWVLVGLLMPLPHGLWNAVGLHCPYL